MQQQSVRCADSARERGGFPPTEAIRRFSVRSALYLFVLTAGAIAVLFRHLDVQPPWDDELICVSVVDHILEHGDWTHLKRDRAGVVEDYLNKPPLYFWLTAATRPWFGPGLFAYRLWSAAFGLGCVLLTFALGRRLFDPEVGFLAGWLLLTNHKFLDHHGARTATMDSALTFSLLGCLIVLWCMRSDDRCWMKWIVIGVACGLMSMLKHLVGIPVLVLVALYVLLFDRASTVRGRVAGALLALAVCLGVMAPWYLAQWAAHGQAFVDRVVWHDYVARATEGWNPAGARGLSYYVSFTTSSSLPFRLFVPALILTAAAGFFDGRKQASRFLCFFTASWLCAFSLARTKYAWYVFPVYPLIAIAIAWLLAVIGFGIAARLATAAARRSRFLAPRADLNR